MSETNEKMTTEPVNLLPCRWKSFVQWPPGAIAGSADQISDDTHDTREQAESVCRMLQSGGLGMQHLVFPVHTWVAPENANTRHTPNPASADVERIAKEAGPTGAPKPQLSRMKSAIEWFKEKGFTFDDKITIKDVIDLQNDARKDGLMDAIGLASEVIRAEATKYVPRSDLKLTQMPPEEMALNGLDYKVSSAILKSADALEYLKASNEHLAT